MSDTQNAAAEWVDPADLVPWASNPRVNDHVVDGVVASIRRFGFGAPIVARRSTREVIAGHTRLKAALQLGLDRVPVRYLDITESQAHELALVDNRIGEDAEWNPLLLERLVSEGLDLRSVGFGESELVDLLGSDENNGGWPDGSKPAGASYVMMVVLHVSCQEAEAIEKALDAQARPGETRGTTIARICGVSCG